MDASNSSQLPRPRVQSTVFEIPKAVRVHAASTSSDDDDDDDDDSRAPRCDELPETRLHRRNFSYAAGLSIVEEPPYMYRVCVRKKYTPWRARRNQRDLPLRNSKERTRYVYMYIAETQKSTRKRGYAWHSDERKETGPNNFAFCSSFASRW